MLGSISTTLSAPLVRGQAERQAETQAVAAEKGQVAGSDAVRVLIDPSLGAQIVEILDPSTGNVIRQLPTSAALKLYQQENDVGVTPDLGRVDPEFGVSAEKVVDEQATVELAELGIPTEATVENADKYLILAALYSSVSLGPAGASYLRTLV